MGETPSHFFYRLGKFTVIFYLSRLVMPTATAAPDCVLASPAFQKYKINVNNPEGYTRSNIAGTNKKHSKELLDFFFLSPLLT